MTDSPASKLVAPAPRAAMPKAVDVSLSLTDFVSPSHWILWAVRQMCGVNPAEWVAVKLGGDWESISKVASSLEHFGDFYTAYAKALREGSATMFRSWEGNAATACETYFSGFAQKIEEQAPVLRAAAEQCHGVAFGAWATSKALVSLVEAILDLAVMAAIEAAAAAATSWTIVGPSVAMALIMYKIGLGIRLWLKIVGYVGMTVSAVFGLLGFLSGCFGAIRGLDEQPLPKGSYDNKVV